MSISWDQKAKIQSSDLAHDDRFGWKVDIHNNYAIVCAYIDHYGDPELSNTGSAYIFKKSDSDETWSQQAQLKADDAEGDDQFGRGGVAIKGDYAVVAAPYEDAGDTANYVGSAYVFKKDDGAETWTQTAKLTASDGAASDQFAKSVAMSGSYIICGSWQDDDNDANASGSAYIFKKDDGAETWTQTAKLTASDAAANEYFGTAIAIDGDYAAVGTNNGDNSYQGSIYVFKKDDGAETWAEKAKLTASDAGNNDYLGRNISIHGDYIIATAHGDDGINDASSNCGAAYIFKRDNGAETWTQQAKLYTSDATASDALGKSGGHGAVSINNNYAIVGAYEEGNGGSAYIFKKDTGAETWSQIKKIVSSDIQADDEFGRGVSIHGNYAIVGAPYEDDPGTQSGAAYIFKLTGDDNVDQVPLQKAKLTNAGISSSNITAIENAVVTNNSTVTVLKGKGLDTTEKRAAALRLIFAKNATITKFKTKGKDMNMGRRLNKENYTVYKKGSTVTLTDDIAEDNGVYSDISETGDTVTFKKDANGQEITFTKVEGGYTATGSTKIWKAGERYTVDGVSYYFD